MIPILNLNPKEINTILISLETVPWKIANPLIVNIHTQIKEQDRKAAEAAKAESELKKKAEALQNQRKSQVGRKRKKGK